MTTSRIKDPERVKARQRQICQAAVELFAAKGYHGTSMRDIARESGVSIGSLYDYIRSKEDILFWFASDFYEQLRSEVEKVLGEQRGVIEELEGMVETMLRLVDRFEEYTLFTYRESKYLKEEDLIAVTEQEDFFVQTFTRIIERGVTEGLFDVREPEIAAVMLTMLTHSWALKRHKLHRHSLYTFQKSLLRMVIEGLRSREDK